MWGVGDMDCFGAGVRERFAGQARNDARICFFEICAICGRKKGETRITLRGKPAMTRGCVSLGFVKIMLLFYTDKSIFICFMIARSGGISFFNVSKTISISISK